MGLIQTVRRWIDGMLGRTQALQEFGVKPIPSGRSEEFIRSCIKIYQGEPPWASDEIRTINFARSVAAEAARLATLAIGVIQREIARRTRLQQREVAAAFEDAGVRATTYDDAIYEAAGLSPAPLAQSPHLIRLMQRGFEATMREWEGYTRTTASAAQRLFIRECDRAYHLVSSGAVSYTQAVRESVERIAADGVYVEYPSGRRDTIETATARAVRTGIAQATGEITLARMEEMEWDIILTSAHLGARYGDGGDNFTNHAWWQGKFYSKSGEDKRFPPFSVCGLGDVRGLEGANCRHSFGPGDGENNPYEGFDSEENKKVYDLSQRQRALERRIRKTKREVMALRTAMDNADDAARPELEAAYQKKAALLQKQNRAYNVFCEENDLKPYRERLQIARWDRKQAASAAAARRARVEKPVGSGIMGAEKENGAADVGRTGKTGALVPKYEDITDRWYSNSTPGSHEVADLMEYTAPDGSTYAVDGKHVVLDYSAHEKEIAELLEREVGGEIFMVPRVNMPQGVRTPDFIFHGKPYDLKTLRNDATKNTIFNRAKKAAGQSENLIFDVTAPELDDAAITAQVKKIFWSENTQFIREIVVIRGGKVIRVARRNK